MVFGGLRVRRRYLLLRLRTESQIKPAASDVATEINSKIQAIAGWFGLSNADIKVWSVKGAANKYVLRSARSSLALVLLATALVNKIGEIPCAIDVLRVSGTVPSLLEKGS